MSRRAIIHLDLDAFYASVEQLRRPELRGRPVIVAGATGHGTQRSVVSAASYEARPFGVHSAMPLATALRLCPAAIVVPVDFPAYRAASAAVMGIARRFTPLVEPLSLDEAYLDVTGSQRRFGRSPTIAATIRGLLHGECGLHASFGVASCKVVAKIASERNKPRGLVVVRPGQEAAFLAPLPLRMLPGLGPATEGRLAGLGITTLGELARVPLDVVIRRVGEGAGRSLWERARGLDMAEVVVPGRPRSISREETFATDIVDAQRIDRRLRGLSADVAFRLRMGEWVARTVVIRVRYRDFTTITRQKSLVTATDGALAIAAAALELYSKTASTAPVRLLGVGVTALEESAQLDMFNPEADRDGTVDRALDELRGRFGEGAVHRGATRDDLRELDFRSEDLRQPSSSR